MSGSIELMNERPAGELPPGIRKSADHARDAFGDHAPAVLRKWFEGDGDRRWLTCAEILEREKAVQEKSA